MGTPAYPRDVLDIIRQLRREVNQLKVAVGRSANRPVIPGSDAIVFVPSAVALWAPVTTTNAMTSLWRTALYRQRNTIDVIVAVDSDGTSDCAVDLYDLDGGVSLGGFVTPVSTVEHITAPSPGSLHSFRNLAVRATRSGVGQVSVQVLSAIELL